MKYVYTLIIGAESECLSYDRKVKKYDVNLLFFAIFYEEVSDDLVSNEGELKWFSLNKLDELEMSYTARYVMDHYCLVGQYSDKIYTGVANENEVIFWNCWSFDVVTEVQNDTKI